MMMMMMMQPAEETDLYWDSLRPQAPSELGCRFNSRHAACRDQRAAGHSGCFMFGARFWSLQLFPDVTDPVCSDELNWFQNRGTTSLSVFEHVGVVFVSSAGVEKLQLSQLMESEDEDGDGLQRFWELRDELVPLDRAELDSTPQEDKTPKPLLRSVTRR